MFIKQISIFLENKSGRLADVTRVLSDNNIDIRALSIADTTNFGVLRLIVDSPFKAEDKLKEAGFTVGMTSVIAIGIDDVPGALADALDCLKGASVEIEYMYAFVGKTKNKALVIIRVDQNGEEAVEKLTQGGVYVLNPDEVYGI